MSTPAAEVAAGHPWQEREDRGYPRAFVETVWAALHSTRAFFAATSGSHGLRGPLLFGVIAGTLAQVLELLLFVPLVALLARRFDLPLSEAPALGIGWLDLTALPSWALPFLWGQAVLLSAPLFAVMYVVLFFVLGGLTHLALRILGGLRDSTEGFAGTFAVACYTMAAWPAQMIPGLGDSLFMVLVVILQVIGLQIVHGTSRGKALLATLAPAVLLIAATVVALLQAVPTPSS